MYRAEITRKTTVSHRGQELCRAFIIWRPGSARTAEFTKAFIQATL